MVTRNEIIDKLKDSVICKLNELDSSKNHDSTLIDYILVMVVNQKSKYEMKHNLALFLGKIVDEFVNWLFKHLAELESVNEIDETKIEKVKKNNQQPKVEKKPENKKIEKKLDNIESKNDKADIENVNNGIIVQKRKIKSAIIPMATISNSREHDKNERKMKRLNDLTSLSVNPALCKKRCVNKPMKVHSKIVESSIDTEPNTIELDEKRDQIEDLNINTQTKFYVTLDGIKDMFKDDIMIDEDFDPELMNEDLTNFKQKNNSIEKMFPNENHIIKKERCKFWPSCLNSFKCEYIHPIIHCNQFPYCRFGENCLYKHPFCKYDVTCSKKDCPFFHTYRGTVQQTNQAFNTIICKYYPNCVNKFCEFFHPKNCHFGAACTSYKCPFIHPTSTQNLPHPSQLKWSSEK